MHLDLTISVYVDTLGRTTGLPTLAAWLSARAFNLVRVASPASEEQALARRSKRAAGGGDMGSREDLRD